ncbi:adhesion G-protein coupled receptor G1-like [Candoia aspera]|uniref:adhesion G-protein coupled receptor G1-like n=1 Tax=Candoia aspera TaxID=51853 RepID=UPI002FD846C9
MITTSSLCWIPRIKTRAPRMPFYLLLLLFQLPAWGKGNPNGTSDMEEEIRKIESKLMQLETRQGRSFTREDPFLYLQHLESTLVNMQFEEHYKSFKRKKIQANVHKISSQTPESLPIEVEVEDEEVRKFQVTLSKTVLAKSKQHRVDQEGRVVMLAATSPVLFKDNDSNPILGGKVIGISVRNTSVRGLTPNERVSITLWHHNLQRNLTPMCVFWVMGAKPGYPGKWDTSGCEVVRGENETTCLCDHLTFFAVLMVSPSPRISILQSTWGQKMISGTTNSQKLRQTGQCDVVPSNIDKIHYKTLNTVTHVGCTISALASLVTIFFLCLRQKEGEHIVYIHMNLLWAILLLDVSFLIAAYLVPTGDDMACKVGGMFLHFGVLACLTWMAIEGYSLYRLVIEVFNSYLKYFRLKLSLVGWGLPMFTVCLIFVINQSYYGPFSVKVYESADNYTNATICWITKKEISNFLNLGYLSLVLFFNGIMLATMVYEILKLRHRERHWEYAVMLLGLSCVLGIPWGLAFFALTSGTFKLVAVYLFTIINSLQGFLIFLWYVAKVLQSRRSSCMQCASSNSMRLQSNSTSI